MLSRLGHTNATVRPALLFLAAVAGFAFVSAELSVTALSQARRTARTRTGSAQARYSQFPHDIKAHSIDCSSSHKFPSSNWKAVRPEADAFPDITEYPGHDSCINCHKQQFFREARPLVCTIYHTAATPRGSRILRCLPIQFEAASGTDCGFYGKP